MSYGFVVSAVAVSGSNVLVASGKFSGIGPCRLYLKNTGSNALTAASVKIGPDLSNLYDFDTTTFAVLGVGAMLSLRLAGPVDAIRVVATCAAGTTLSAWLADEADVQG